MFYDGLYKHDGNEHPENIRQYGFAFDRANPSAVSLGGMRISSRDILANNHLIEF